MCEELSNYTYFSCQSSCLLLLSKFAKIIREEKTLVLVVARNEEIHFFELI